MAPRRGRINQSPLNAALYRSLIDRGRKPPTA